MFFKYISSLWILGVTAFIYALSYNGYNKEFGILISLSILIAPIIFFKLGMNLFSSIGMVVVHFGAYLYIKSTYDYAAILSLFMFMVNYAPIFYIMSKEVYPHNNINKIRGKIRYLIKKRVHPREVYKSMIDIADDREALISIIKQEIKNYEQYECIAKKRSARSSFFALLFLICCSLLLVFCFTMYLLITYGLIRESIIEDTMFFCSSAIILTMIISTVSFIFIKMLGAASFLVYFFKNK